ncbi:MAG: hypothetical protein RIS70_3325 [Planctomycetota bacterium]
MFTGLVEGLGSVADIASRPPGVRLVVQIPELAPETNADVRIGESIALNGCCLTVVAAEGDRLSFDLGPETLQRTNLGRLAAGSRVNWERSLRFGDRLGGHLVTGHIDTVGKLDERTDDREWSTFWFRLPAPWMKHLVSKGCIAVDGVSLTVVAVEEARFSVSLIPHTLAVTTLGSLRLGDEVNLETDLLAKYVERQCRPVIRENPE